MKQNAIRQPMNSPQGARITFRLTAEQEIRLKRLDRKVRRQLVPCVRRRVDSILKRLETSTP